MSKEEYTLGEMYSVLNDLIADVSYKGEEIKRDRLKIKALELLIDNLEADKI